MLADAFGCCCSYHNQEGIQIRPFDFGGLGGIYSIDPALPSFTSTYKPIIEKLQDAGYTANQDLFGAPYDFRLAGDGLESVGLNSQADSFYFCATTQLASCLLWASSCHAN